MSRPLPPPERVVYRNYDLPASLFDWLLSCKRRFEAIHGEKLTNSQALALILREHRESDLAASIAKREQRNAETPVLLREPRGGTGAAGKQP